MAHGHDDDHGGSHGGHDDHGGGHGGHGAPEPPPGPPPPHVRTIARITRLVGLALWAAGLGGFLLLALRHDCTPAHWSAFASLYGFCIWLAARTGSTRLTSSANWLTSSTGVRPRKSWPLPLAPATSVASTSMRAPTRWSSLPPS